jgi:hypothetical protein
VEATYLAVKNANVRDQPSVRAAKVAMLPQGAEVHVAGRVIGMNWYLVERDDKPLGYVYGELLMPPEAARVALAPPPKPQAQPAVGVAPKAPGAYTGPGFSWKMQTSFGTRNFFHEMAERFADRLRTASGGRARVKVMPVAAVVKAWQVHDAVAKGVLDAGWSVPVYAYGKNKALALFSGVPFSPSPRRMAAWLERGGGTAHAGWPPGWNAAAARRC